MQKKVGNFNETNLMRISVYIESGISDINHSRNHKTKKNS